MNRIKLTLFTLALSTLFFQGCTTDSDGDNPFTGNEVNFTLIPGEIQGNSTTGTLSIKERTDGKAQVEIILNGVINGAVHPVHLHFGSLDDNGLVATYLNQLEERNGVGISTTTLTALDDGTNLEYTDLIGFDGSVKIHFEESGPLKDVVLGATNIGINGVGNKAYLLGDKSITSCNNTFERN